MPKTSSNPPRTKSKSKSKEDSKRSKRRKKEESESEEEEIEEEIEITKLLKKLKVGLLRELIEGNRGKVRKTAKKEKCVEVIMDLAYEEGNKMFVTDLEKDLMKEIVEEYSDETIKHSNKTKLLKELKELQEKAGTPFDFFEKLPKKTLAKCTRHLGFELSKSSAKSDLVGALEDEIIINGLTTLFDNMKKDYVADVAEEFDVSKSKSKKYIINQVLARSYSHLYDVVVESGRSSKKDKKKKKKAPVVIKKPGFKKGVTYQEYYDAYYSKELQDWCREQKIKVSGNKKEVIRRIIRFLNGDTETTRPLKPGEKRKKRKRKKKKDDDSEEKPAKKKKTGTRKKKETSCK